MRRCCCATGARRMRTRWTGMSGRSFQRERKSEFEVGCRRDDAGATVGTHGKQVFVAGDDQVGVGALGALEKFIVIGVAAEVEIAGDGDVDGSGKGLFEDSGDAGFRPATGEPEYFEYLRLNFPASCHRIFSRRLSQRAERYSFDPAEVESRNPDVGINDDNHPALRVLRFRSDLIAARASFTMPGTSLSVWPPRSRVAPKAAASRSVLRMRSDS